MTELIVPQWAEADSVRTEEFKRNMQFASAHDELELLRSFYLAWEALHSVPSEEKQAAAETLVRIAHAIKAHRG